MAHRRTYRPRASAPAGGQPAPLPARDLVHQPQLLVDHREDLRHHRRQDSGLVVGLFHPRLLRRLVHGRRHHLPGCDRCGRLGPCQPGQLGVGHRQLRLLDRHRSRRNADLRRVLFLLRQKWRTSINRAPEAMTIFAVVWRVPLPCLPRRSSVVRLVSFPLSQPNAIGRTSVPPLLWDVFAV